jgi:outer membrane protein assembly factor BamA
VKRRPRAALVLGLAWAAALAADGETWKLARVSAVGSLIPEPEIVRASGLVVGSPIAIAELSSAASRLAATGAFATVSVSYERAGNDLAAVFKLHDADEQLSIRFENFVWADDSELLRYLTTNVALFRGKVAPNGAMVQRVADALTGWLAEHDLHGKVESRLHGGAEGVGVDSLGFAVSGIPMPVRTVEFENAPSLGPEERKILTKLLVGTPYEKTAFMESAMAYMGPVYSKKGMLKAGVGSPRVWMLGSDPAAPELAVTFPIVEGPQYRIAGLEWKRSLPEGLAHSIQVEPDAIADASQLASQLDDVRQELARGGYLKVRARGDFRFAGDGHTVSYVVDVDPGPLFHMGRVQFVGFPESDQLRLTKKWKLEVGAVFRSDYVDEFLSANADALAGHSINVRRTASDANVVDLTIQAH